MKEVEGDIWNYHEQGHWIVITTNGNVKKNGQAVMGRGVALQAAQRFPKLSSAIGKMLRQEGNHAIWWNRTQIITLPVKHNWWERADLNLIERSCQEIVMAVKEITDCTRSRTLETSVDVVYLVRPGCGNGGLDWQEVKPILGKYLDDRFVVVERRTE